MLTKERTCLAHVTHLFGSALAIGMLGAIAACSSSDGGGEGDAATSDDTGSSGESGGGDARDSGLADTQGVDVGDGGGSDTVADTATTTDTAPAEAGDAGVDTAVPPSSVPTKPITFTKDKPFTLSSGTTNYVYVPAAYDSSHKTPITLFVWLHGCGGFSSGDVWTVSPGGSTQKWITMAVGGAEGGCWDMSKGPGQVLAALADIKTHFNIKPKGVIMGGYSSGGDLSYRTMFYNASLFAGILVENTSPFRDTGSSQTASLAAASWKFNVVHLAHLQDTTYGIAGVRKETDAMTAAGFPMKRNEVDGGHWDDAGAIENGHAVPGTAADIATYLFPYLGGTWSAP